MKRASFILLIGWAGLAVGAEPQQDGAGPRITARGPEAVTDPHQIKDWPARIARHDEGSKNDAWAKPGYDDSWWKTMKLPVHWEDAGLPGYDGVVWFRRSVTLDAGQASGKAVLSLGAIDDMDVTWVNGVRVGGHEKAGDHFTPRNYALPDGTLKAGANTIAVRVMDHGWNGGLAQTHGKMQLTIGGTAIPLTGLWRSKPGASLAVLTGSGTGGTTSPRPEPFKDGFALRAGDVVALAGGTTIVKQSESGYLETILTASTEHRVAFRNIGWQADTVYRQQRPRSFGTQLELLNRINATVIVANFGQMEALDGATRLTEFIAAYEKVLDEFEKRTPRIVLVPPHPFQKPDSPHLPDLTKHNGDVAAYTEAIRQLAKRRGFLFADLGDLDSANLTTDGVQFSDAGHQRWAEVVASGLTGTKVAYASRLHPLRAMIQRKNVLWHQHWRPTNWSFLYGNRQHVPSSHDHRPGQPRWFPKEVAAIIPMIGEAETRIQSVKGGVR